MTLANTEIQKAKATPSPRSRYPCQLTDTKIKNAKAKAEAYSVVDGGGLYLRVTPAGGKLWRWSYRFDGKEKLMSLGEYPYISLSDARQKYADARVLLAKDIDPMAQRKAEKTAKKANAENSFQSVATRWMEHWHHEKSPRHVEYVKRRLEADILPVLGSRPIAKIQAPEIVAMVMAIEARGAGVIARRALQTTAQIFRHARVRGYADRNPASEFRPSDILKPVRETNYARIEARELPDLLRRIEIYQGTHVTRLAIKLMALTFLRTSELIEAPWTEFDFEAARWDIPAERMKSGKRHIVPLARQTLEVLGVLHDLTGHSEWLFPGDRDPKKCMSNNTILKALERMGYKGAMTGHGFRGLASTILHELGYKSEYIELQLAHLKRDKVSDAYDHARYLGPRTTMMHEWADFLEKTQKSGKAPQFAGKVA
ncbi:tyrosine-type recombinase/integrase [Tunturiibacter gelidiferens]|uniref:tyrosine-type recombinase/integrase n=1 Tax=Tunturiibacter gelidiferens TaxID=3069689 RepID=UPI003D9B707D